MDDVTFVTTDPTRWGTGTGTLLPADVIDINFWALLTRISALMDHPIEPNEIVSVEQTGPTTFVFHMSDSTTLGPITLPISTWRLTNPPSGAWLPTNIYLPFDVFSFDGTCYLVALDYTSGASFDPNVTDGMGHDLLRPIVTSPADVLPLGGNLGDVLTVTVPGGGDPPTTQWLPPTGLSQVQTQDDHTWVPALTDANTYNRFTNIDGCIVIIPTDAEVNFPIGTEIHCRQANNSVAPVIFEAASPCAINPVAGFINQTAADGGTVTLKKVDIDSWDIFGLLAVHS